MSGSNRAAKAEAARTIPFDRLAPQMRRRIAEVVKNPSIYRRMPVNSIDCDPELFVFLVRNPEVVVNIWDLMGITKVSVKRVDEYTMHASDGAGTKTVVELLYGDERLHLLYATGVYEGTLFKNKIRGNCVLLLRSEYEVDMLGRTRVKNQLDIFLKLENAGIDLLAKAIHPLVGKTIDHNFAESAKFLGRISQAAESNAGGVQRLAARLTKIKPDSQAKFAELTAAISHRAAMRGMSSSTASEEDDASDNVAARILTSDDDATFAASHRRDRTAVQDNASPRRGLTLRR